MVQIISSLLFLTGLVGLWIQRRHLIGLLISLEIMFLASVILFVGTGGIHGQMWSLTVLTASAAEAAVGLALIVAFYRQYNTIAVNAQAHLKG